MAKIEDLIAKEDFVEHLKGLTDYNQIIELFSENGIQVAKEEAKGIITALSDKDELVEEDLSGVFGGMTIPQWLRNLYNKNKGYNGGGGGGGGHGF